MASKKSFVLRLDEEDYRALERWAAAEFRSVNGQLEYLIHEALVRQKRLKTPAKTADQSPGENPDT